MHDLIICMSVQGSIPYVPYLRAPYYVWVGHVPQFATILQENKVCAPASILKTVLECEIWCEIW